MMFKATILAAVLMAVTVDAAINGGNVNLYANVNANAYGEKTRALKKSKSTKKTDAPAKGHHRRYFLSGGDERSNDPLQTLP